MRSLASGARRGLPKQPKDGAGHPQEHETHHPAEPQHRADETVARNRSNHVQRRPVEAAAPPDPADVPPEHSA